MLPCLHDEFGLELSLSTLLPLVMVDDCRIYPVATSARKAFPTSDPNTNSPASKSISSYPFLVVASNCFSLPPGVPRSSSWGRWTFVTSVTYIKIPNSDTFFSLLLPGAHKTKIKNWKDVNFSWTKSTGKEIQQQEVYREWTPTLRNGHKSCASKGFMWAAFSLQVLQVHFWLGESGACGQEMPPHEIPGDWRSCLRSWRTLRAPDHAPAHPSIHLSIHPSIYPSTYPSIYPSINSALLLVEPSHQCLLLQSMACRLWNTFLTLSSELTKSTNRKEI